MRTNWRSWCWKVWIGMLLFGGVALAELSWEITFAGSHALAQIIPDRTLGNEGSIVTPNTDVKGLPAELIEGGALRNANLFHSFKEFNVGDRQRVYFANPNGVENILTRITGGNPSNILGTLGVDGGANLFLLNPNGIIFGPNAQLDIRGSFVASTASRLLFEDGGDFSATNPEAPPLLTINLSPGLQYGTANPEATIANTGNLSVGQDLTLAADNLNLQGQLHARGDLTLQANDTVAVRDSATNPFIASAGEQLLIQGNQGVDIFALNNTESGLFAGGDMVLRSAEQVGGDAHYWSGGNFRIEQLDGNLGNLYSFHDPIIRSVGDVSFNNYLGASLHIIAGGSVTIPGIVKITGSDTLDFIAEDVTLSDGTVVSINGSVRPTFDVRAGVNLAEVGNPLGVTGTGTSFFDPNFIFPELPNITNSATSADININYIVMSGAGAADGVVFLTNNEAPNHSLPGGKISVGTIRTDDRFGGFTGRSGEVIIDSRSDIAVTNRIESSSFSGDAGDISLIANGAVSLENSFIISETSGAGNGGDINIRAESLFASNGAEMHTSTFGQGNAGNVRITASDTISLDRSNVLNQVGTIGQGNSGDIEINTGSLSVINGAELNATTFGQGNAGNVRITARDVVSLDRGSILNQVGTEAVGNGGDIEINTGSLSVINGAELNATTFKQGNAGNVRITARDVVSLDRGSILNQVGTEAVGNGGDIEINTGSLSVINGAELNATTFKQGNAGNVRITASDTISFDRSNVLNQVGTEAVGNGGDIEINTGSLSMLNGAQLNSSTKGQGDAGIVRIHAGSTVSLDGMNSNGDRSAVFSQVAAGGRGNSGGIEINTGSLSVTNGALIDASTNAQGNAGSVRINAPDTVSLDGMNSNGDRSAVFSQVATQGVGNSGGIEINTGSLSVTNGALIDVSTKGQGDAGSVRITAPDTVSFDGVNSNGDRSAVFSQVAAGGRGNGRDIEITTGSLSVTNGGLISSSILGQGDEGSITVRANTLEVTNGGQLLTSTASSSNAGDITLMVLESVSLAGANSALFANTTPHVSGNGGSISIDSRTVSIRDGAKIAVDSQGTGKGGSIQIQADLVTLNNQALISADTASNTGGDITLQVPDLLGLRNNSRISTTAGNNQEGGDGGNITIDTGFIIAVPSENSDISANAFTGRGGRVDVTAQGIFGIEFRDRLTSLSDITARSQFGVEGVVKINTPNVDPSRGLAKFTSEPGNPEPLQGCQAGGGKGTSRFVNTGRGGLPPNPYEPLDSSEVWRDVQLPTQLAKTSAGIRRASTSPTTTPDRIVEAQGWSINENGDVELVAELPTNLTVGTCRLR